MSPRLALPVSTYVSQRLNEHHPNNQIMDFKHILNDGFKIFVLCDTPSSAQLEGHGNLHLQLARNPLNPKIRQTTATLGIIFLCAAAPRVCRSYGFTCK